MNRLAAVRQEGWTGGKSIGCNLLILYGSFTV